MRYIAALAIVIGLIAFQQRPAPELRLALVDLNGARQDLGTVPAAAFAPRISPNGKQVAFDIEDGSPAVWIADFPSLKSMRRLPGFAQYPMWSEDGLRILFIGILKGQALFSTRADGSGSPELLAETARAPEHWLPKMQSVTFITLNNNDYDIWRYSFADRKATPLIAIPGSSQHSSRVSPDERSLAYVSDESGRLEVYVQPLPATGGKFQITTDGGEHPVWSPDGAQLYFNRGNRLYSVAVKTTAAVSAAAPAPLPITGFIQGVGRRQFDITADGKQFLMLFP